MGETTDEVRSRISSERTTVKAMPEKAHASSEEATGDSSQEASAIRSGIAETRSNLSATIDALQEKLDPTRITEQVKDQIREKASEAFDSAKVAVKEATIGKAEKIMSNVSDAVSDMTGRAGTAVGETGSSMVQYIRDNPVPLAFLGIGLGLLAMNKQRSHSSSPGPSSLGDSASGAAAKATETARAAKEQTLSAVGAATSTVRDAATNAAEATRQQLHDVTDRAREGTRMASERLKGTWHDNPMALGVAALAAGALVGLSLPSTEVEGEYMGEARDRLVGQAKSVAQDVVGKVQRVTEEAGETVKSAAQIQGLVAG